MLALHGSLYVIFMALCWTICSCFNWYGDTDNKNIAPYSNTGFTKALYSLIIVLAEHPQLVPLSSLRRLIFCMLF